MFVGSKTLPLDRVERIKMAGKTRHTNLSYYIYSRRSKRKDELFSGEGVFFLLAEKTTEQEW